MPRSFLFLVLFSLLPAAVWAEAEPETALDWLRKVTEAQQTLNYYGNFVYIHGGQLESMKVIHAADAQGERERLVHLNGSAREVIRNNDEVMCIFPEDQLVLVSGREEHALSPILNADSIKTYEQNYDLQLGGNDHRIAGVLAQLLELKPKDNYRYGYRFLVSHEGLLLRSDLINERGQLVEQIMFTEVKIVDKIDHHMLTPEINIDGFTWHRQAQVTASGEEHLLWRLKSMPQGFFVASHSQHQSADEGDGLVEQMSLSDGLASVSVFIEQMAGEARDQLGSYQMGALNVYAMVVRDHHITVVGDVPAATVKMIAEAVELSEQ